MHKDVYKTDGGYTASDCEKEGSPGDKESMPGGMASFASKDGYHDTSAQDSFAAAHGRPQVSGFPEGATPTGEVTTTNPTAAEGAGVNPTPYPHAGPPARTTSV